MAFPLMEVLGLVFKPIVDLVDDLTLSAEEKLRFKQQLFDGQLVLYTKVLDFEARVIEAQSRVVEAEAKSESYLTANWRPLVMVVFTGLVVARWFGFSAPNIPPEIEGQLWTLLQIGLGGYVGGRSLEKVAEVASKAIVAVKSKETP